MTSTAANAVLAACALVVLCCRDAAAQPAASPSATCDEFVDEEKSECDDSDVLVLLDRSSSMVAPPPAGGSTNFDAAQKILDEVVAAAAARSVSAKRVIEVRVIGFPDPDGARGNCDATAAVASDVAKRWRAPRARRGDRTPLLQTLSRVSRTVNAYPPGHRVRLLLITDGEHWCPRKVPYDSKDLVAKLAQVSAGANGRIVGAEAIVLGSEDLDAAAQRALDAAFPGKCRVIPSRRLLPRPVGRFPDVVAVGRDGSWPCSGVLVETPARAVRARGRVVLTARHCLPATQVALLDTSTRSAQTVAVVGTHAYPDPDVDAALLVLERAVDRPTHVMRGSADRDAPVGVLRIVGIGADDVEGAHGGGDLHVVDLPMSGWGCDARTAARSGCRVGTEFVVRGNGGNDACRGDSGAPAFEQTGCEWRLLGLVSRSLPAARRPCGDGGIYTRIDALAPWLVEQVTSLAEGGLP